MAFEVGETVQVQYLTDEWLTVTVAAVREITPEQAAKWREYYPDMKAGEPVVACGDDGDTRSFYAYSQKIRHLDGTFETPPVLPFEAKIETGEAVKPMSKIQLKPRAP